LTIKKKSCSLNPETAARLYFRGLAGGRRLEVELQLQHRKSEGAKSRKPNLTGIPTQLKLDFEQRSGLSFDDVRVHYNSEKPARLGALAYTQGTQIHVGPGQERTLPHELGHVVQQKRGLVRPTGVESGHPVNLSPALERSARTFQLFSNVGSAAAEPRAVMQFYRTAGKPAETKLTPEALIQRGTDQRMDLREDDRQDFQAEFRGGRIYFHGQSAPVNMSVIYVLSTDDVLYIHNEPVLTGRGEFTHSNFLGGAGVRTAGEMYIQNGIILSINNGSGHYQPGGPSLEYMLDYLLKQGVDLSDLILTMYDRRPGTNSPAENHYNAGGYDKAATAEELENFRVPAEEVSAIQESQRSLEKEVTFWKEFMEHEMFTAGDDAEWTCEKIAGAFTRMNSFRLHVICEHVVMLGTIDGITGIDQLKRLAKKGRITSVGTLAKRYNNDVASIISKLKDSEKRALVKKLNEELIKDQEAEAAENGKRLAVQKVTDLISSERLAPLGIAFSLNKGTVLSNGNYLAIFELSIE